MLFRSRAAALDSGDVDVIATSDSAVVGEYDPDNGSTKDVTFIAQSQYSETNYILLHLSKPGPLQSKEVRCALWQAIDKQDAIDTIANGYGQVANGPFSPGQEGNLADNGALPYDPEAAAAAIADYEAANGPITINYSTTTGIPNSGVCSPPPTTANGSSFARRIYSTTRHPLRTRSQLLHYCASPR